MPRHSYGPHRDQFGDLTLPRGDETAPVAVLLHGGYWRARYGLDQMDALATDLAHRGWAAWNLEYRRVGLVARGGYPRTLDDVAAGIDHLIQFGPRLDLGRVVAIGHSAGGQLALWAAARPDPGVRLTGVAAQAPVSDLEEAHRQALAGGSVTRFLGGSPEDVPEHYRAASPIALLPIGVPQLLVHGERDEAVPASMSVAYTQAARDAGDTVTLVLRSGDGHFAHLNPQSAAWAAVIAWLDELSPDPPMIVDETGS